MPHRPPLSLPRPSAATVLAVSAVLAVATGCSNLPPADTRPSQPPSAHTPAGATPWAALLPPPVLLLGEQHDAPDHQRLQREAVAALGARGALAAVVLEMAEAGHGTQGLPRDADEATVRAALAWNDAAWPWERYGPVVMEAVRAGVPVLGGNLPRARMRDAMHDPSWDARVPPGVLRRQIAAMDAGHCGLLPASQWPGMARIQIARDASLARTAADARRPGQAVLLIAGAEHVRRDLGIPLHWDGSVRSRVAVARAQSTTEPLPEGAVDTILPTPALPPTDHCAALRR